MAWFYSGEVFVVLPATSGAGALILGALFAFCANYIATFCATIPLLTVSYLMCI